MAEAATTIQAVWRGYRCRKQLIEQFQDQTVSGFDPAMLEQLHKCAVKIQVCNLDLPGLGCYKNLLG